tara:strand:- start:2102 stop:3352 length:1251 start_codon:yes stop_codon:yes gene_type:complete
MTNRRLQSGLPYYVFVFFSILLIVLNPYTIYGKPGVIFAGIFAFYSIINGMKKSFFMNFVVPTLLLLTIATFGALSSNINNIPQINHPLTVVALLIMILAANGVFLYCEKKNISIDDFLLLVLLVVVLNSVIILLELQFDSFRSFIEGYLDPISGGSINYAEGYRLRGLASSGGAGLSISIPAALIIALHLFDRDRLNFVFLLILFLILLASVVVIGRTGIVLLIIPVSMYLLLLLFRRNKRHTILKTLFFVLIPLLIVAPLFYQYMSDFFSQMFGDSFVKYSVGFLLDGISGLEEEGTVGVMAEFIKVLPMEFPQALTGYGFYGGSDFYPWTDAGFNRTFLSVGFLFGSIFYVMVFYMYLLPFRINKYLIGTFVLVLTVAEIKEPLLFSGVASRMFILILVYYYCGNKYLKTTKI